MAPSDSVSIHTIDDVVVRLDQIVADCKSTNCTLGYFAVLYRRVTHRVKAGILAGEFEDNARMERLVVIFASRYLDAYHQYQQQLPLTQSWKVAFDASKENQHIVMQHLLLGINAHINLDLGIAAVAAAAPAPLQTIQRDFDDINRVLSELVDEIKNKIGRLSPAFGWLMPMAKKMDEKLVSFSIQEARDGAWRFAGQLSLPDADEPLIADRDQKIYTLGYCLVHPTRRLQWLVNVIGWLEWRTVAAKLELLEVEN